MISIELREALINFAENETSIQELEKWIVPRLPILIREPSGRDSDLVAAIELGLAEYGAGIRSENELRSIIRAALLEHISVWANYPAEIGRSTTNTNSTIRTASITEWSRTAEITLELA